MIRLAQSSQRILLMCKGQGLEPHIEFERNLIEFGPILPHSAGDEQEVRVRNPGKFPVEIYSLEYDKMYLEEEKVTGSPNNVVNIYICLIRITSIYRCVYAHSLRRFYA